MGLSGVVIAYNEAANIDRCLSALSFCDEIVVLDSFSTDNTLELARKYTDTVAQRRFTGFSEQKTAALEMATQDWVLIVDADEVVTEELAREIVATVSAPQFDSYEIPRLSYYLGTSIRHCGWYPDYQLRLARRAKARFPERLVHETLVVDGPRGRLTHDMVHYTCAKIEDSFRKAVHYSLAGAEQRYRDGRRFRATDVLVAPGATFFKQYVLKRGFKDGTAGLVLCAVNAASVCFKYAALWAIQQKNRVSGSQP